MFLTWRLPLDCILSALSGGFVPSWRWLLKLKFDCVELASRQLPFASVIWRRFYIVWCVDALMNINSLSLLKFTGKRRSYRIIAVFRILIRSNLKVCINLYLVHLYKVPWQDLSVVVAGIVFRYCVTLAFTGRGAVLAHHCKCDVTENCSYIWQCCTIKIKL